MVAHQPIHQLNGEYFNYNPLTNQLPLYLLNSAIGQPILVELKSGQTLNGHLTNCDSWMNVTLDNAIQADAHGENFLKIPTIYVRGIQIKSLRMSNDMIAHIREKMAQSDNGRKDGNRRGNNRNYNQQGRRPYNQQGGRNNQQNRPKSRA